MSHPHYNNFFMGHGRAHFHSRLPPNNVEMYRDFVHEYGHGRGSAGPIHRFPRFPFLHSNGPIAQQQRLPFEGRFQFPPYFRQERHWNSAGPRRRFPNVNLPSSSTRMTTFGSNRPASLQKGFVERRQTPNNIQDKYPTQYVLRTSIGDEREHYRGNVNRHFTAEVCASVNFTIRAGSYKMPAAREKGICSKSDRNHMEEPLPSDDEVHNVFHFDGFAGDTSPELSDEMSVAVESELPSSSSNSDGNMSPNNYDDITENDIEIEAPQEDEVEGGPANPDIVTVALPSFIHRDGGIRYTTSFSSTSSSIEHLLGEGMASCDDEGFHEAFVGICISRYPFLLGRMIEVAGYGVWFSDGNKRNFSGVLKPDRLQTVKGITIHGSSCAIEAMKKDGYSTIRINLETDYLNENVVGWISKYMDNPTADPSNWDEYKYNLEILQLCKSAAGMIIKWSHCGEESLKKAGIDKAKQLAKKATDARREELLHLQEAVGSTQ